MSDQHQQRPASRRAPETAHNDEHHRGQYRLPHQLDTLVLFAASNQAFAEFLCAEHIRIAAQDESGLDPAERAILRATSPAAIRQLITPVRDRLAARARRHFCALAAAAMASFLAGGALLAGSGCRPRRTPHRPRAAPQARKPGPVPVPYYPPPDGEYLTGTLPSRRPVWEPEWQEPPVPPRRRP